MCCWLSLCSTCESPCESFLMSALPCIPYLTCVYDAAMLRFTFLHQKKLIL